MNFKGFFRKPEGIISLAVILAAVAVLAFSTHKSPQTSSQEGTTMSQTELPSVSATAGEAPVISKPAGTPPEALVTKDIIEGNGAAATSASTVTAQYVLMSWKTGTVIQSSWSQGPATFPLSAMIPGWQQGIPGMKVGGRQLLVVPPALGYGATGSGPVGPNETLVFVVDLVAVK